VARKHEGERDESWGMVVELEGKEGLWRSRKIWRLREKKGMAVGRRVGKSPIREHGFRCSGRRP